MHDMYGILCSVLKYVVSDNGHPEIFSNSFTEYNQQDATFLSLFISVRCPTRFRRFFRPSSGAQNCTYSVRPLLLPAASPARLAAGSSNGLKNT